jgi:hypothetical protein
LHGRWNFEGESAVAVNGANIVISCPNLDDLVRHYGHWNANPNEDGRHNKEKRDSFGKGGYRQPSPKHLLFELLKERR